MNRANTKILSRLAARRFDTKNFAVSTVLAKKREIPEDWLPLHLRDEAISAKLISTKGRAFRNFQTIFGWSLVICLVVGIYYGIQNLVVASAPLVIGELSEEEIKKIKTVEDNSVETKWLNLSTSEASKKQ
ncbi:Oidioi.mRNA.OKI2018_I69.chr1.g918.t1.cds [Oikopleura dioica]|uniref:Oidioi.mRNA.OKI2018_I69.chr1.g918.t1.cds n=1 Tax=Oikopleura dioica TaxID=34765 RepID=A0ABN7STI5_OIKDI|nr:Oidioi.mRNA.OKI2018_I69.chr1.g918.t1.cds [Oikopleura dioica]